MGVISRFRKSRRLDEGVVSDGSVGQGNVIGDIEGPTAMVGPRGTVSAIDGSWHFEWGAGADDRWHVSFDEVAVRQSRIDDTPVFETAMRVPGGDVICRSGAAADGVSRFVVIEFTNESPSGVALGCVLRFAGSSRISVDRSELRLDDRSMLIPERRAGAVATGSDDPWTLLAGGPQQTSASLELDGSGGFGAMIFPLPHRASLVLQLVLDGVPPQRVPAPVEIASGWRAITRNAATIEVPDLRLGEAWLRILPDLVIAAGSDDPLVAAEAAPFLDIAGLHDEADRARATVVVSAEARRMSGRSAVTGIEALASRDIRAGQISGLGQLIADLLADAGDAIEPGSLRLAALALAEADQRLADDLLRLAETISENDRPEAAASSSVARGAARVVSRIIGPVVDGALDLLPSVPADWFGQPVDVRGVVTHVGTISFSLRWHGDRPALLWERHGGPPTVTLTCSGLDPAWSSTLRTAEALLAAPRRDDGSESDSGTRG